MNRKRWAFAAVVLGVATASLVALAGGAQDLDQRPPDPQPCICPQIYQPVTCVGSDGRLHEFTNSCFAGCAGYTRCTGFQTQQ